MVYNLIKKEEFDRVKNSSGDWSLKMNLFAEMNRYNTLVAVKKAGSGHLGSSLSSMDIITYLYLNELNVLELGFESADRDVYFSSKGHDVPGLYSLFYALGILPEQKVLSLRRLHGLDGHPEARQNGIEASTGSLGMGIAKAKGMAWAKNYNKNKGRVFVLTGDGEFQEGQIYESLQVTAHQKVNNVVAIMDHNKYQTDMLVEDVNNIEDIVRKIEAFGWYVVRIDGHDYNTLRKTFSEICNVTDKPKFIVADTVKGKGVSFMERPDVEEVSGKTYYKWHSGAPNDDSYILGLNEISERIISLSEQLGIDKIRIPENTIEGKASTKSDKEFVKDAFGEGLLELGAVNDKIIVLDGDLSADCGLRPFEMKYPERFIENGIAEQDMVSMAGGLARQGLIPVVNSFASFLAARGNEQIYNNAGELTKVIYAMHFSGIIPAGPGKSHQSVRDISLMGAIPNMEVIQPCNAIETKKTLEYAVYHTKNNVAIRLAIGPSPETIILPENYSFEKGQGTTLVEGKDAIIFAYGPVMLHEALLASRYLLEIGIGLKVVNMPWLTDINFKWLLNETRDFNRIYVLEDHDKYGGLGSLMALTFAENSHMPEQGIHIFGLDEYPECGTPWEVLPYHGLDGMSIAKEISGDTKLEEKIDISEVSKKYTSEAPQ